VVKAGKPKKTAPKSKDDAALVLTIQKIFAKQLKCEPAKITLSAHMQNDLGADSLDALEILFGLEEAFDIKIPEQDARGIVTVQDAVNYIKEKVKK
jgi:acyl carrier protein